MPDVFSSVPTQLESPARNAEAADISSTNHTFSQTTRGVYVGGAGNLIVVMAGGQSVTFTAIPAGTLLPICVESITRTSTTASSIVGLW